MSIEAIRFALPSILHSAKDIANETGADEAFIKDKVGLDTRYILSEHETGIDLSIKACLELLNDTGLTASDIDVVVCVTQNPDKRIPHNAPQICERLGLSNNVASFDLSLGCSGWVYGVMIVESFMQFCNYSNALLITCDPYSKIIAKEDKATNCIFGDMATVTWIKKGIGRSEVLSSVFGTDGAGADAIEIKAGGASEPFFSQNKSDIKNFDREALRLNMQGRAVFNFVMKRIPSSINESLQKAGLTIEQIDYFALHQGSKYMLESMAKQVSIPESKLLKNMNRYGNTVSSTIPSLLAELDAKQLLDNTTILASGFGVGLSWATIIIKFN